MAEMDANETHGMILGPARSGPRVMLDVQEARRCTRRNPRIPCNRCQSEGMERCECHGSVRRIRFSVDEECKEDQRGIHVWAGGAVDGRNRWYPNAHLAVGIPSCPGRRARPPEDPGPSCLQTCSHHFPADDVSALGSIRKTAHLGLFAVLAFVAHPIHDVRIVQGLPCLYDRSLWMVTRVPDSSAGGFIRHNPQASPQAALRLGPRFEERRGPWLVETSRSRLQPLPPITAPRSFT